MALLVGTAATPAAAVTCSVPSAAYPTIQLAVDDSNCDTIDVGPGSYPEQVDVDRTVTLLGAQANADPAARTAGAATESNVVGSFTVRDVDVTINGFAVTGGSPSRSGIVVKTAGHGALITFNVIENIGSLGNPVGGPRDDAVGIYLERGPDNVSVIRNKITRMLSTVGSGQGILVGDSTSADPSEDVLIGWNIVEDNASVLRGAYGIQINNGASATGFTTGVVRDNRIDGMTGNWARGIGLEGPTPDMMVFGNDISNLLDQSPAEFNNAIAVHLEQNPDFATVTINQNNFNDPGPDWGIVVNPNSLTTNPSGVTDGTCNWWSSPEGPGGSFGNPESTGAWVSDNVDYDPWLVAPAPGGACIGGLPPAGKATGGGQVPVPDGRGSFGFNARLDEGETAGHLNYRNHVTGAHLNCTVTAFIELSPTTATFSGTCNPQSSADSFTAHVEDHGEPGKDSDVFEITYNGITEGGTLTAGNIQIGSEPAAAASSSGNDAATAATLTGGSITIE